MTKFDLVGTASPAAAHQLLFRHDDPACVPPRGGVTKRGHDPDALLRRPRAGVRESAGKTFFWSAPSAAFAFKRTGGRLKAERVIQRKT
jgi:hypothetical protein